MSARNVTRSPRRDRGFTLVELMVSMVISLLIALAALGSARVFMAAQRQSVGVGTASGNAVTAMASVKHEAEQAALGFFLNGALPCQTFNLSSGTKVMADNAPLSPLRISNSSQSRAQLDLMYADSLASSAPAFLLGDTSSSAAQAELASFLPVQPGQAVMLAPLGDAGLPCTVKTAVRVDAPQPSRGPVLYFDASGLHNQATFTPVTYSSSSALSWLGAMNWSRFAVDGANNLVMSRPMDDTSAVVARNVMGFQVQYGVSDGITPTLSGWEYGEGAWATMNTTLLSRVRALRIGLVLRSEQPEKPDSLGNCSATVTPPVLLDRSLALSGNWQCYRYRTSTVVVPLRNILMGSSS